MTEIKYNHYTELVYWEYNPKKIQEEIKNVAKTQFTGQALVGNKPSLFIGKLHNVINDQLEAIQQMKEEL
jgi:hypothetical protein